MFTDKILNKFATAPAGWMKTQEARALIEKARALVAKDEPERLSQYDVEVMLLCR